VPTFLRSSHPHPDDEVPDGLLLELDDRDDPGTHARRGHVLLPAVGAFLLACIGAACLMPDLTADARHLLEPTGSTATAVRQAANPAVTSKNPPAPSPAAALANATASSAPAITDVAPGPASAPTSPAPAEPSAQSTPEDLLAGPVDDDVLQQSMEDSLPNRVAAQDPVAAASPQAGEAVEIAWQALTADLLAGGWSQPHRQVAVLTTTATVPGDGTLPATVSVAFMWSATTAAGELTDREISTVDLNHGGSDWAVDGIRTMGQP